MNGPVRTDREPDVPTGSSYEEAPIEPVTPVHEQPPTLPKSSIETPAAEGGLLGGVIPEERPELLVAAAFAGGAVAAILLRTLVRR